MIEAVVFDLGNTLFSATEEGYRDDRCERRLGLSPGILAREIWGSPMERAALAGEIPYPRFWDWVGRTLALTDEQLAAFEDALWTGVVLPAQVAEWLPRLKARVRLAALSNAWSDARGHTEGEYGLEQWLEFIAYSAEIGCAKPDPRAYANVIDRLGVRPDRVVFVDDSQVNVDAAADLGMRAVRCTGPDQMIRDVELLIS